MIGVVSKFFVASAFAAQLVSSHAVLVSPAPFIVDAKTRGPCGITLAASNAINVYAQAEKPGATVKGVWQQQANDGAGRVTQRLIASGNPNDIAGGGVIVQNNMAEPNGNRDYPFEFKMPALQADCQGSVANAAGVVSNNVCLYQFRSNSNWHSCMYIALLADPPPPPKPTCELLSGLVTCNNLNGKYGIIPVAQSPKAIDDSAKQLIADDAPFSNSVDNVFNAGERATCTKPLLDYVCSSKFKQCNPNPPVPVGTEALPSHTVCKTRCQNMAAACVIDPDHSGLYDCDNAPETSSDVIGLCPARLNVPAQKTVSKAFTVMPGGKTGWDVPAGLNKYSEMAVFAGDRLQFNSGGGHNVYKFNNKAAYDACDFSQASMLSQANAFTYHVDMSSGVLYFGCQVGEHCKNGQKVMATVHAGGTCTAGVNAQCALQNRVGCGTVGSSGFADCGACVSGYSGGDTCVKNAEPVTTTGGGSTTTTGGSNQNGGTTTTGGSTGQQNGGGGGGDFTSGGGLQSSATSATAGVVGAIATVVVAALL